MPICRRKTDTQINGICFAAIAFKLHDIWCKSTNGFRAITLFCGAGTETAEARKERSEDGDVSKHAVLILRGTTAARKLEIREPFLMRSLCVQLFDIRGQTTNQCTSTI